MQFPKVYYGMEYLNICRSIRMWAREGRLVVEQRRHKGNQGKNLDLFAMLDLLQVTPQDFVVQYLSNLQPYALGKFEKGKASGIVGAVWLKELDYSVAMVIKIDVKDKSRPLVVSFHEGNVGGRYTSGKQDFDAGMKCAVFISDVQQKEQSVFSVSYVVQRGFLRHNIMSDTSYVMKDVALVDYSDIKGSVSREISMLYSYICDKYMQLQRRVTLSAQDVSFVGRGYTYISNIVLLIDMFAVIKDISERAVMLDVVRGIVASLTVDIRGKVRDALVARYGIPGMGVVKMSCIICCMCYCEVVSYAEKEKA